MSQLVKLDKDYASWIQNLSADLREALPGVKGLSETSIKYAKRFYMLYNKGNIIGSQLGD